MTLSTGNRVAAALAGAALLGSLSISAGACGDAGSPLGPSLVGDPAGGDRGALVAQYNAAGGPGWTDATNWLSDGPLDTWYGVETANDRVTKLDLCGPDGNNLRGTIAPELGNLTTAVDLRLSNNYLAGGIPATLGRLGSLEVLRLSNNALSGPVPAELANLTSLVELRLHQNRLTGELPRGLMNLPNLRRLRIEDNAGLCAPADADFRAWLATLEEFVSDCDASAQAASAPPLRARLFRGPSSIGRAAC